MLTKQQIQELAEYYKIDGFTIVREYLQLVFLNYLYQHKKADKIYFIGGTAIRLLFGSPRFSEDLDFAVTYSQQEIKEILKKVEKNIQKELGKVKIALLYKGQKSIRFRLKYIQENYKYPFAIRLDFSREEIARKAVSSPLVSKFPIIFFPLISHFSAKEILAEKIRSLMMRGKGRDLYDIWFLLQKKIDIDESLVKIKLKKTGINYQPAVLQQKIKRFPLQKLERDLGKFLPEPQRKIIKRLKELDIDNKKL